MDSEHYIADILLNEYMADLNPPVGNTETGTACTAQCCAGTVLKEGLLQRP